MNWYYISFSNGEFKGGMLVQALTVEDAFDSACAQGADPEWKGIAINTTAIGAPLPDPSYLNRLLSREDIEGMDVGGVKGATGVVIQGERPADRILEATLRAE